uniref:WD_REPEATS_REGION domain-containing protein n=1 Tax=Steinernema glaseri TaxID=37863 RepID=A0A1I8A3L8_9BILA
MGDDVNESWRNLILDRVKQESHKSKPFEHIFGSYRNVCDTLSRLAENDARRRKAAGIAGGGSIDEEGSALLQQLEDLKATHQEMLKKKEVNDQRLITAKYDVERLEKEKTVLVNGRDNALRRVEEVEAKRQEVLAENKRIREASEETEKAMTELRDEHMVLQMLHTKTSADLKQCQMDRDELLERLKELKMKQIEFFNMETEREEQRQHQRKMEQINEAMRTMTAADKNLEIIDDLSDVAGYTTGDILPTFLSNKIEGHEGEITDLVWMQHGDTFFSASSDHNVLEYDVS